MSDSQNPKKNHNNSHFDKVKTEPYFHKLSQITALSQRSNTKNNKVTIFVDFYQHTVL